MMSAGPGNLKVLNPMIAPIHDEGGLCKGQGGQLVTDDRIDVFTKPCGLTCVRLCRLALSLASQRLVCSRLRRHWARLPLPHRCHALRRRAWSACAPHFSPFSAHFWLRFATPVPTIASTPRLWFYSVSLLPAISLRLQPRCWPLVGRAFVPHCSVLRSASFACLVWVPRVFRWPRQLQSRSSPRLW
jgi:hypothetical protein